MKNLQENINEQMRKLSISSVANGYKSAWKEIMNMIESGKTNDEIISHGNWVLENSNIIEKVAKGENDG